MKRNANNTADLTPVRHADKWETASNGSCRRLVREHFAADGSLVGFEVISTTLAGIKRVVR